MNSKSKGLTWTLVLVLVSLPVSDICAQEDKVAALRQSLAANQKQLVQYQWVETTIISLKGEQKSQVQNSCRYGPDGKVQKQQISAPAQQSSSGGVKGRVIAKKKEEVKDYTEDAATLVKEYVPPNSERIEAAKNAGNVTVKPVGSGVQLGIASYLKPGDMLTIDLQGTNVQRIHVDTYLDSQKEKVTLDANFAMLNDGTSHPAQIVLVASAKSIQVVVQNSNYQKLKAISAPPAQAAPLSQASGQGIDSLTAPIALYPDALIAQILTAATNPVQVKDFAGWLEQNKQLQGSALQEAAQKAGFDTAFVALAPFEQVVQMMAQQPDWTKQLGEAFMANKSEVFDSIQRLRAQAQAAGNLKTTERQQVQTQTTSSGQQVIAIQPANPQVVYVPTYNPQTVYVQSSSSGNAAAAAAISFTTGVIIGAASNNYYYGPYAWNGAAMYNQAWNNWNDYANQRQNMYQQNASQRQANYQQNSAQRQSTAQANQTQRQSTATSNQAQRQSAASTTSQANQAARQSSASTAQGNAQANQAARQSAASTSSRGSGEVASQRSGMNSGGFSGFEGRGQAHAESARGGESLRGGGGGGGGGRTGGGGRRH